MCAYPICCNLARKSWLLGTTSCAAELAALLAQDVLAARYKRDVAPGGRHHGAMVHGKGASATCPPMFSCRASLRLRPDQPSAEMTVKASASDACALQQ